MRSVLSSLHSWHTNPKRLRIRTRDRIFFAKRLSLYLRAGIPILYAVDLIRETPGSAGHARLLRMLSHDIQGGLPLSQALGRFPRAYPSFHTQLIAVGETSGTLPAALAHLAEILEAHARRLRTILSALAYPAILLLGSLGISGFLILYVFPKIIPLFRGLHAQLPFTTRILISLSNLLQKNGLLLGLLCAAGLGGFLSALRMARVKASTDAWLLRIPGVGAFVRVFILATVFRTLSTLLSSGVRLDEALSMAEGAISNTVYRSALMNVLDHILAGGKFSNALCAYPRLFPSVSIQLVSVGEMTGTLSESTSSIAHIFEEECAERIQALSSLLEPIIMVLMGLIIGFVALAIISPMYGITQSLSA